ncbi:MAG TPA: NAD(P)-binding domain-containing protein [Actinopolymorphaceae bacterium]
MNSTDSRNGDPRAVTVIGLGPMGQAMVRALLKGGHPVTVWNRTPSRADDVVAEGASRAPTPADAVRASDLVILSLTDYQAMYDILGPVVENQPDTKPLSGKTIVNLSSDTPQRTREASDWASGHGARFLTGGVMNPAPLVGSESAYVYVSGPREILDEWEPTLRLIGAPRFVGTDPAAAQLMYQAQLDVFLTALSALLHGTALVESAGVPASVFVPEALQTLRDIDAMLAGGERAARQIETGVHPGDLSTATMMGATADHILSASVAAGIDLELPRAVKSHYDRAIAAGHGKDDWTSLYEVIKRTEVPEKV